jgi:hypothetical protein
VCDFHTCVKREVVRKIGDLLDDCLFWLNMLYLFFGIGLRRLFKLRGFVRLSHWNLLRALVTLDAVFAVLPFFLLVGTSFPVGLSVTRQRAVLEGWSCGLDARAPSDVVPARSLTFFARRTALSIMHLELWEAWVYHQPYCVQHALA